MSPQIARYFRLADPAQPLKILFSGHRGVGKSTELHQVIRHLETPESSTRPFHVVYIDLNAEVNLGDAHLADVFVAIASVTRTSLSDLELPGFDPVSTLFKNLWEGVKSTLGGKVNLDELVAEAKVPGTDIGLALKASLKSAPGNRQLLRDAIDQHRVSLLRAINDLFETANAALAKQGRAGLVLIADGLERTPIGKQDVIFGTGADQLAALKTHAIFTVPINLVYGEHCTQLAQTFGGKNQTVPMIRLKNPDNTDNPDGLDALNRLLDARAHNAGVEPDALFDSPQTRRTLCDITGGHPRNLLILLQTAIGRCDQLPVSRDAVDYAIREQTNQLQREIPGEYWQWLLHFADGPKTWPNDIPDDVRRALLYYLYVYEYQNGNLYYDVNPAIRLLPRFRLKQEQPENRSPANDAAVASP
ncbi:MAG: hypothetical protein LBK99_24595 [Opitutaceae bacterium]|nr:hypothetical protein [Opitutaceae bacterium]